MPGYHALSRIPPTFLLKKKSRQKKILTLTFLLEKKSKQKKMLTGNKIYLSRSKVFEDFQGTFFKKFLEWGMGQRPIVHTLP